MIVGGQWDWGSWDYRTFFFNCTCHSTHQRRVHCPLRFKKKFTSTHLRRPVNWRRKTGPILHSSKPASLRADFNLNSGESNRKIPNGGTHCAHVLKRAVCVTRC